MVMGSDNHQETHPTGWVVPIDPIDPLEIKFSRSLLEISPRSISPDRVGSRDRFEPARKPLLDSPLYLFYSGDAHGILTFARTHGT